MRLAVKIRRTCEVVTVDKEREWSALKNLGNLCSSTSVKTEESMVVVGTRVESGHEMEGAGHRSGGKRLEDPRPS